MHTLSTYAEIDDAADTTPPEYLEPCPLQAGVYAGLKLDNDDAEWVFVPPSADDAESSSKDGM